jgi:hypothetical protein
MVVGWAKFSEATFDRYVQEKILVNYDPAEEIQAEIRQQKVEAQTKEANAKLAAAKDRAARVETIKAKKWPADYRAGCDRQKGSSRADGRAGKAIDRQAAEDQRIRWPLGHSPAMGLW